MSRGKTDLIVIFYPQLGLGRAWSEYCYWYTKSLI